ncbi:hypothetical protein B0H11DRAFT_2220958 [Mycena galericulata]|nr:hypothetical protein B0H11DRAFT_2220958 [Mycena galericulata]
MAADTRSSLLPPSFATHFHSPSSPSTSPFLPADLVEPCLQDLRSLPYPRLATPHSTDFSKSLLTSLYSYSLRSPLQASPSTSLPSPPADISPFHPPMSLPSRPRRLSTLLRRNLITLHLNTAPPLPSIPCRQALPSLPQRQQISSTPSPLLDLLPFRPCISSRHRHLSRCIPQSLAIAQSPLPRQRLASILARHCPSLSPTCKRSVNIFIASRRCSISCPSDPVSRPAIAISPVTFPNPSPSPITNVLPQSSLAIAQTSPTRQPSINISIASRRMCFQPSPSLVHRRHLPSPPLTSLHSFSACRLSSTRLRVSLPNRTIKLSSTPRHLTLPCFDIAPFHPLTSLSFAWPSTFNFTLAPPTASHPSLLRHLTLPHTDVSRCPRR